MPPNVCLFGDEPVVHSGVLRLVQGNIMEPGVQPVEMNIDKIWTGKLSLARSTKG